MMHFIDSGTDGELLAELKDAGVLAPGAIDQIHQAMGRPESGTLTDFLLAGAKFVPETLWLSWLIRRHGCHRFGRVFWHADVAEWTGAAPPVDGNLPYRRGRPGELLIAVLRPDLMEATSQRLQPLRLNWAAGTLSELRDLRIACLKARSDRDDGSM